MTNTSHRPRFWTYDYSPYTSQDGHEIPAFEVFDDEQDKICDTNEDRPVEEQEAHARLMAAAPELLDALEYFFNIMHDYQSSVRKGYVEVALAKARAALANAMGKAP